MTIKDFTGILVLSALLVLAVYNHEKIKQSKEQKRAQLKENFWNPMQLKKYLNERNTLNEPIRKMVSEHIKLIAETDINSLIERRVRQHEDRTRTALSTVSKDLEEIKGYFKEALDKKRETPEEALQKIKHTQTQEIERLEYLYDKSTYANRLAGQAAKAYGDLTEINEINKQP